MIQARRRRRTWSRASNSAEKPPELKELTAVTPQEEIIAVYFAMAKNIKAGMSDSDIKAWGKFFRTTLFTLKVLRDPEAKEFATIGLRQEAVAKYFAVAYTPIQWIYKIVQMKRDRESLSGIRLTHDDLAALFDKHKFKAAKGQEEMSPTFCENALYIHRQALCFTDVQDSLIKGAEFFALVWHKQGDAGGAARCARLGKGLWHRRRGLQKGDGGYHRASLQAGCMSTKAQRR